MPSETLRTILVALFGGMIWMTPWAAVMTVNRVRHGRLMEAKYGVPFWDAIRDLPNGWIWGSWAIGLSGVAGTAILLSLALGGA
ncbi:hypothetical protein BH769_gp34 [Gordonia phage BritBrat]|uniref:Uncharacterized protein n=1 Tax=Gordonia phage BritBrat TaxID=1838064 RepID=A0A166XZI9_9CAUD|nr:hypothetical protein BH769_gp34 [Gordonia phage BritBrat]ANA85242.1 hypothetical protein PBI_BRITBRAT_34 [Gordonia phage BritBrat]